MMEARSREGETRMNIKGNSMQRLKKRKTLWGERHGGHSGEKREELWPVGRDTMCKL